MPSTLRIWFEEDLPPTDRATRVCGRALTGLRCKVNRTAAALGVVPLACFFGEGREGAPDRSGGSWFEASDGLSTVQALRDRLRHNPTGVCCPEGSIEDLEAIKAILREAAERRVRFRFALRAGAAESC
jgi:hypothetical protein